MSNVRFELVQNSLTVRATSYTDIDGDNLLDANERGSARFDDFRAGQNGDIDQGWTSLVRFGVVNSCDAGTGRWATYTDRFFVDQGEGIGVRDGQDEARNSADRKRLDSDERMFVGLGAQDDLIREGKLVLDRVASLDGSTAKVTLHAYDTNAEGEQVIVASKTFDLGLVNGRVVLDFTAADFGWKVFDGIQIQAGDNDTRFTFRSVDFDSDALDGDSLGGIAAGAVDVVRSGLTFTVKAMDGNRVIASETLRASQNGTLPDGNIVSISAVDSPDGRFDGRLDRFTSTADRTWADFGEGLGIMDGADDRANSMLRKRIDGDETLLMSLDKGLATKGSVSFSRIENTGAGDDVLIRLLKDGKEVFADGYDLDGADKTPDFGGVIFDTIEISAIGGTAMAFNGASFADLL
ncbi:hypothetical protein [Paracraurococcus ruber]|uniref:Uncharacterized protein n=1 Tax=Paracraurococcus ruber TaxID=77675 RepID=A0ABS1CR70_9PROT|nr:hypothetical protein [Paracraurococcus ruber]MBK1656919.1 hypothetical protein [Paracraurococcus ruber]TDG33290.1 hypothetical protein E2C05_04160 [Paracraurococcus ruber]